ncbi:unnamed protein product [Microthlaspi erraticum]|uniref:KIB1-4 beta-propeller domain-containing protein n=1 Tax=Microthlaspi erraticum TaxID=1685480 RepID=A0A6D2IRI5_9BRAS|nr:unnamed protein product [Microthlaspi erraticum]
MVYKDHKLYLLSAECCSFIKIFDFSGETPREIFRCGVELKTLWLRGKAFLQIDSWCVDETKLVVTVTGDVLKVERRRRPKSGTVSFRVYRFYTSSGVFKKYERVVSLGDEAMIFDLGVTVVADDEIEGIRRNCIYFNRSHNRMNRNDVSLFNLETRKMEPLHMFDGSSVQVSSVRWFLPSFTQT